MLLLSNPERLLANNALWATQMRMFRNQTDLI